ncbi:MAG: glycosyltransferase [Muribaculaceae bacterium]|nr:glycosyltransferase [Muribaculaceae bacterium]
MISILIPAYNCEPWLEAAVRSVFAQTCSDWELLILNDGSTDHTLNVARRMASEDSRLRVIDLPHRGVAAVRNEGLANAKGDYIFFLDADDLLPDYTLEYLLSLMADESVTLASGRMLRFADGRGNEILHSVEKKGRISIASRKIKTFTLSPGQGVEESLYQTGIEASLCGKLFRRSQFEGIRFVEGELYEDLDIFFRILLNGRMIIESDLPVYLYRQRRGSIIHTFNRQRLVVLDVTRRICEYVSQHRPEFADAAADRRFSANYNILQLLLRHSDDIDFSPDEKITETYAYVKSQALRELLNPKVRRKNKIGAAAALLLPRQLLLRLLRRL